ncbi:Neural Wiskott-Aldrich syndrome protein [Orchesella cincta]|uniref:Neural Wiskott-Aldrich syndrome protein n=1 Tax=Orchesella cincta TaxID=48709 RepID=A0A1D2N5W5_ORCCI|nr:Neural Wiskott-Aldrich syndrome protein [Orchesella cincta]
MMAIQKGVQLKKVDVESQPKRAGGIAGCLSEIQRGVDLKPVPESAKAPQSMDAMDGLAGALARALADRQRALNPDSSSSEDEDGDEYDEEEWE